MHPFIHPFNLCSLTQSHGSLLATMASHSLSFAVPVGPHVPMKHTVESQLPALGQHWLDASSRTAPMTCTCKLTGAPHHPPDRPLQALLLLLGSAAAMQAMAAHDSLQRMQWQRMILIHSSSLACQQHLNLLIFTCDSTQFDPRPYHTLRCHRAPALTRHMAWLTELSSNIAVAPYWATSACTKSIRMRTASVGVSSTLKPVRGRALTDADAAPALRQGQLLAPAGCFPADTIMWS